MWICPRCAAHLPPDSVACPCGGRATDAIRDGCAERPPAEGPSFRVAAGAPDVRHSINRWAVEACFKYGILASVIVAILWQWVSWRSKDSEGLFAATLLLLS